MGNRVFKLLVFAAGKCVQYTVEGVAQRPRLVGIAGAIRRFLEACIKRFGGASAAGGVARDDRLEL